MLLGPKLIERLAETLEGIAISNARDFANDDRREASVLIYHADRSADGPVAGESPLLELSLTEAGSEASLMASSALGIVELHGIEEVRLLEATEEAAFYARPRPGWLSVLTVSSRGVMQVYMNVAESLIDAELTEVSDDDLRAAVALKIFAENAEIFKSEVASSQA